MKQIDKVELGICAMVDSDFGGVPVAGDFRIHLYHELWNDVVNPIYYNVVRFISDNLRENK
jgi:hypothetical protein